MRTNLHCKRICTQCTSICKYRLSELNVNLKTLTDMAIKNELYSHHHPKSRQKRDRSANRSSDQAKIELANHYRIHHGIE